MAINFDSLPSSRPTQTLDKGLYLATIAEAAMKQPKDPSKPMYLNLTYTLVNAQGQACGKFWDILSESDNDLVRYKIKSFIDAIGIQLQGSFELADLVRIVPNRKLVVALALDEKGDRPRNQVDLFTGEPYYPVTQWASLTGSTAPVAAPTAPAPAAVPTVAATDDAAPFDIGGDDY